MPTVLLSPKLRLARLNLAEKLLDLSEEFRGVYLPYPKELEKSLNAYARGIIDWRSIVEEVKTLMPGFARGWLWVEEPLIRSLRLLGKDVRCYGDSSLDLVSRSGKYLSLLFRARVSKQIDLEEWRQLFRGEKVPLDENYVTVASRSVEGARNIDTWGLPYPPTEDMDQPTIEKISALIEYVFNYILPSKNLDDAYLRWLEEKKGVRKTELRRLLELVEKEDL
jgi:hypothetical protein